VDGDQILLGDNLGLLGQFPDGSFQLIYIDPPFNTGRRQHRRSLRTVADPDGDRTGFGGGLGGQLRGLAHAHMGWMFSHPAGRERERMARDLSQDRLVRFIDRTFVLWAVLGFVLPFALGFALTGTWRGALTGLLWGGLVRLFLNHHVTWSVNSICHYFGRRPFPAYDLSTNNWLLALPSLGESWHHNHHVFPTSAFHGLGKMQLDASGLMIRAWEKMGWVTQVRRPTSDQILRKLGRGD